MAGGTGGCAFRAESVTRVSGHLDQPRIRKRYLPDFKAKAWVGSAARTCVQHLGVHDLCRFSRMLRRASVVLCFTILVSPATKYLLPQPRFSADVRSRGSTQRTRSRPLGRQDSEKVRQGNTMTARVMILCLLMSARSIWWLLEQPGSSIMELHPSFQSLLALIRVHKLRINMMDYGGDSRKATVLYSSFLACD